MSEAHDSPLAGKKVLIAGGTRGLGLGIVESLAEKTAELTVLARNDDGLKKIADKYRVKTIQADANDERTAETVLKAVRPDIVILNAGAVPPMGSIAQMSWDDFSFVWNNDVKSTLFWAQAALRIPLSPGSRVILTSSGAAVAGSPLSGGYAGAKRMIWMMAGYANGESNAQNLGIKFQAVVARQLFADTRVGQAGANDYARRRGISTEEIFAGFPQALSIRQYGDSIASILTDSQFSKGNVFSVSGDQGIVAIE